MSDVHDKQTRSYNMSQIKGKNTKPELLVRKFLFANGFRYRVNDNKLPGKPDIVLPKYKTTIFVNGCFWHGHINCKYFSLPKTRTKWWKDKIEKNRLNDIAKQTILSDMDYNVIVVWECEIKNKSVFKHIVKDVKKRKI
ncbi:MAG: very short patch repair endonuclease [Bacteroidia bacterium]